MKKLISIVFLSLICLTFVSAFNWSDGRLVSYYKFAEASNANAIDSLSTYNLTCIGTITNVSGKIGSGKLAVGKGSDPNPNRFENSNVATLSSTTDTVCSWFKIVNDANKFNIMGNNNDTAHSGMAINYYVNGFQAVVTSSGYASGATYTWTRELNWHFLCGVYGETTNAVRMYLDGVNVANGTWDGRSLSGDKNVTVFADLSGINPIANITLDELGIWNRSLSYSEIQALYNSGTGLTYSTGDSIAPSINFSSIVPNPLNLSNFVGANGINLTYNISDDVALDTSKINLFFKSNDTNSDTSFIINGTSFSGFRNTTYFSNSTASFLFRLFDNNILPATYNFNETLMENTTHYSSALSTGSHYASIQFLNTSNQKQYSFLEFMANRSSGIGGMIIYYCNSSYLFNTQPVSSSNCINFFTLTNNTYNHCHSNNISCHMLVPFAINTSSGKVGNIAVTSTSYFLKGTLAPSFLLKTITFFGLCSANSIASSKCLECQ